MLDLKKYSIAKMDSTEDRRLRYLLQYHHSLCIQSASRGIGDKIEKVEFEIERLLDLKEQG